MRGGTISPPLLLNLPASARTRFLRWAYERGTEIVLELVQRFGVRHVWLLKDSPACGRGYGITAKRLEAAGIVVHAV